MKFSLFGIAFLYLAAVFFPFLKTAAPVAELLPKPAEESSISLPKETALPESYPVLNSLSGEVTELSPLEYIKGVTAAEMPLSCGDEALKAQMIACHSLALYRLNHGTALSDDPNVLQGYLPLEKRQELLGDRFPEEEARLTKLCEEVLELILTYNGSAAEATYFTLSSGRTESSLDVWGGDVPYLIAVDSSFDLQSADLKTDISVEKTAVAAAISELLGREEEESFSELYILSRSESGMVLSALAGDSILSGQELRTLFSLPSANFTLSETEDSITFHCIGKGHGVGMSQFGAMQMAAEGKTYAEILAHYYPGTELKDRSSLL